MNVANASAHTFEYQPSPYTKQEQNNPTLTAEDILDTAIFEQLLSMDDDANPYFSYSIVLKYFEQANKAFQDMDAAFARNDLSELSRIGHFLKGSSVVIGLKQIKVCCEEIQNLIKLPDHVDALQRAKKLSQHLKYQYEIAEQMLKEFYETE